MIHRHRSKKAFQALIQDWQGILVRRLWRLREMGGAASNLRGASDPPRQRTRGTNPKGLALIARTLMPNRRLDSEGVDTMDPYTTLTDATCEFSKSPGSALCAGFEPRVRVFTERRLDGDYHFFLVDVIFIKSCEDDRVVSRGAMIVTGVFSEGYRSIIGVMIGDTECFTTWDKIFRWLKGRGLKWVMFVITDDHGGLAQAVKKYFQGASWQRCRCI